MDNEITTTQNPKAVFRKCGTCSQTFAHLLNRAFGNPRETEEHAIDPLAGGIINQGHQCGMLWGTAMAIGTEAFRRFEDKEKTIAVSVTATQKIVDSFVQEAHSVNCKEIIGFDLSNFFGLTAYMIKTMVKGIDNSQCFNFAEKWAPEAIQTSVAGLEKEPNELICKAQSCTSKVVKRMGGTDEEQMMVAGFAGGLGLSGHACGALAAAIWMKTLEWCKANPGKTPPYLNNPNAKKILKAFKEETNSEMLCHAITGQRFENIDAHSKFLENGGCEKLIEALSKCS
ncbi:MAG: C-GCAxxG-C-C family protein [Bacteroidetes bacterium]|jgi:hypothetical protein|nr:C-GCAxxG-C-C family protein [Bacteroidota bacterium]